MPHDLLPRAQQQRIDKILNIDGPTQGVPARHHRRSAPADPLRKPDREAARPRPVDHPGPDDDRRESLRCDFPYSFFALDLAVAIDLYTSPEWRRFRDEATADGPVDGNGAEVHEPRDPLGEGITRQCRGPRDVDRPGDLTSVRPAQPCPAVKHDRTAPAHTAQRSRIAQVAHRDLRTRGGQRGRLVRASHEGAHGYAHREEAVAEVTANEAGRPRH